MAKLSKDGSSIEFKTSDTLPSSAKKFRQSPEIQGFYSFIYDNDLQHEASVIINKISARRKAAKGKRRSKK